MNYREKVAVYLHSDAVQPDCDCGVREWDVQLPNGWMWVTPSGPGPFTDLEAAVAYAAALTPGHPDVKRSKMTDEWLLSSSRLPQVVGSSHD
jgi:hypothetical protein